MGLGALLLALGCAAPPPAVPPRPSPAPTPEAAPALPPPPCERVVHIRVSKSERRLHADCARGARLSFPVALGRVPQGHKLRSGDLRTPEGEYRVSAPARPSRHHRFLPIDYPSVEDTVRAWKEGRIDGPDYRRIVEAHARGEPPPGDTPLGGGIGLHGEGERWRGELDLDWTYGCIALRDADLDLLLERTAVGTPVSILPPGEADAGEGTPPSSLPSPQLPPPPSSP